MWFFIILGVMLALDVSLFIVYKILKKKNEQKEEENDEVIDNDVK